ncbi:hypothetical protein AJ80_08155 [Polytolypa hystricis UAMH7299]|uniref:Uncharacterized protein n=1 Tax=Polytolypa hystricis (strain UAMH7299) TaxID=1447883 RepID=A0A2B7XBV8_POLH7|nr:hypothetical protein AJ80_08155 [Polytolypa hystricis UAMH7299]
MSNNDSNVTPSASPNSPRSRRASFTTGTSFTELFTRSGSSGPPQNAAGVRSSMMSAANAQAQQQRRRMSITTLGLSGSPPQVSPFSNPTMRRGSVSSSVMSTSPTGDVAVMEENEQNTPMTSPTTPFARRVSFGAHALRDRAGGGNTNGEGFNWPETLRTRAERAPSFGSLSSTSPTIPQGPSSNTPSARPGQHQHRAASVATVEQPIKETVPQTPPKQAKTRPKPDYFQEKILRADFMD